MWAVIEAPSKGWTSPAVLAAGALAAVALVAFVVWQRRVAEPLLDVRLFENPRFTAASSTIMVLFFALFGFLFLSTQYLQFVLGYSPSAAGVRVLPYAGAMIVFAPLSSKLVALAGTKRVVTTGMLLFATGLAVAATVTAAGGTDGSPSRCSSWARAWASRALRRPSRSWARSRPSGRTSARPSTTRRASSAARSASPSWAASCRRSTRRGSQMRSRRRPCAGRRGRARVAGRRRQVGGSLGAEIAEAAREAFVHAMSRASIVAALVAALGAFIAWRYLPSGAVATAQRVPSAVDGAHAGLASSRRAGVGPGDPGLAVARGSDER